MTRRSDSRLQSPASPERGGCGYAPALGGVLLAGALLRLGGIDFGLPQLYHWDEKGYYHAAFYALAHGGSAESMIPGNIPYLLLPVLGAIWMWNGLPTGSEGLSRLVTLYLRDPTPFYLVGRGLWVGMQVVAIWACYWVGRDALSRRAGLLGAGFLSVAFLSVSEGHYIKGDSTAMLGAVLAAWAALSLLRSPSVRLYLLLGAAVGFTIACKYYTYTLAALPLVVHVLAWPSWGARLREWWRPAMCGGAALLVFVLTIPAWLVDPGGSWDTFRLEATATLAGFPTGGVPGWLYFWTGHLWDGLGWPLLACGVAGFLLWGVRGDARRFVLLATMLLLWLGVVSRSHQFARYAMPVVPFVALAAGDLLDRAAAWVEARLRGRERRGAWVAVGLLVAALAIGLPSLANDVRFALYASSSDTRTIAAEWIERNLPAGASIVGEGGQGFEATSTLGVPVRADPAAVGVSWLPTKLKPDDEFWRVPLLAWLETYTPTYRVTFAPTLTRNVGRVEVSSTEEWGNPDAFVALSWRSDPEQGTPPSPLWDDLSAEYRLAARFDCAPCLQYDPYAWAIDYQALAQADPLRGGTVAGPRVWVYTRRK